MRICSRPSVAAVLLFACTPTVSEPASEEATPQKRYSGPNVRPAAAYPAPPEVQLNPTAARPEMGASLGWRPDRLLADQVRGPDDPVLVELTADHRPFYPVRHDLVLEGLSSTGRNLVVALSSDRPEFTAFAYGQVQGGVLGPELGIATGPIDLDLSLHAHTFKLAYWFQPVDKDGARGEIRQIGLSLFTAEHYAAHGRESEGVIIIDWTEIPRRGGKVDDWLLDRATAAEVAFAEATWGSAVNLETTTSGKVTALAKAILNGIGSRIGIPSDALLGQPPFEQYRRAAAGIEFLWCDNHARIFQRAASSFGIGTRRIELLSHCDAEGGFRVCTADGHATTEYFDEEQNRWIWIDLTGQVLAAHRANGAPLDAQGFQRAFNDPDGEPVVLSVYDPSTRTTDEISLDPREPRWDLKRFFNPDQRFLYYYKASAPR